MCPLTAADPSPSWQHPGNKRRRKRHARPGLGTASPQTCTSTPKAASHASVLGGVPLTQREGHTTAHSLKVPQYKAHRGVCCAVDGDELVSRRLAEIFRRGPFHRGLAKRATWVGTAGCQRLCAARIRRQGVHTCSRRLPAARLHGCMVAWLQGCRRTGEHNGLL